jgi:hypothetical protein
MKNHRVHELLYNRVQPFNFFEFLCARTGKVAAFTKKEVDFAWSTLWAWEQSGFIEFLRKEGGFVTVKPMMLVWPIV